MQKINDLILWHILVVFASAYGFSAHSHINALFEQICLA